jgi:hypothetical protein
MHGASWQGTPHILENFYTTGIAHKHIFWVSDISLCKPYTCSVVLIYLLEDGLKPVVQ